MDQQLRFCDAPGGRVAYATAGSGPPLLIPALWVSHLEQDWADPDFHAFMAALCEHRTVIRYDRLGTGLSDRDAWRGADDLATFTALVERLELDAFDLFGMSAGGATTLAYAAAHPTRVRTLTLSGAFAHGAAVAPPDLRAAIVATVRAHWGTGARLLSDVWLPGADPGLRDRFVALQRVSASAEVAADILESVYATDVRSALASVTAPTVVIHRREDRAIPHALARDLAAEIPNARLVTLEGAMHPPWLGNPEQVLAAFREHVLGADAPRGGGAAPRRDTPSAHDEGAPLSAREREVLGLVGQGFSDAEIAERLVLSPHTVHRHVANIRAKLRQPSRAAAAAHAARHGLI